MKAHAALDLSAVLARLASRRPVFHSEADLQHELAWQLRLDGAADQIRLEYRPDPAVREAADLWLVDPAAKRHVVEVKYLTRRTDLTVGSERFVLTDQSAHDTRRYDVLRDLARIERWTSAGIAHYGTVVVLTNDPGYWHPSTRSTNDRAFRIHEGREVTGRLAWAATAGPGSIAGRETALELSGRYVLHWQDYATLSNGQQMRALRIHLSSQAGLRGTG